MQTSLKAIFNIYFYILNNVILYLRYLKRKICTSPKYLSLYFPNTPSPYFSLKWLISNIETGYQ